MNSGNRRTHRAGGPSSGRAWLAWAGVVFSVLFLAAIGAAVFIGMSRKEAPSRDTAEAIEPLSKAPDDCFGLDGSDLIGASELVLLSNPALLSERWRAL